MLSTSNIKLQFGKRILFDNVSITFTPGNCYGVIGANGSGKSTFLKILSGEIETTEGSVNMTPGARLSVLKQDQFAYDDIPVLQTVIMGHQRLYRVAREKDALYAKPDFNDADGIRVSELEAEFAELNGWSAESEAGELLNQLGIGENLHAQDMRQLEAGEKVRVLLAQALFGNPDILLLDEPTNQLDIDTRMWLEEFLANFDNIAIVVSHDRHFLDKICTHICDIDFSKIQIYTGNFTFWQEASDLALRQRQETNKKVEDKRKELQDFVARFSANASKSRQATSRKKMLEKLSVENIPPSSRKYPFIGFEQEREAGNEILHIDHMSQMADGQTLFRDLNLTANKGDKIAFIGRFDLAKTALFEILMGHQRPSQGVFKWGATITRAYFPKNNDEFFNTGLNMVDWLRQYSSDQDEQFVRGFLGRMLFTGEEGLKPVKVLSGGEKVRCMLSRMMLARANVLILDEPTNHLDLESITALNRGLEKFQGTILFSSQDHQFVQTVANRIVEITPHGTIDKMGMPLDDYLEDPGVKKQREDLYARANLAV
jgi:ATPase subunit of ABC transporter with duplicated ATPase domains